MNKKLAAIVVVASALMCTVDAFAQYRSDVDAESAPVVQADSAAPVAITLDQALEIALSENVSVKIADKEIQRTEYAKKGTYAALYPSVDATGSYQRTLIKNDIRAMMGDSEMTGMMKDTKIGNSNSFSVGATAAMPVVNAQLWASLKVSGLGVEAAVEKARSSRLEMVTQVKQAYYAVLLAKEAFNVYKDVYENAVTNFEKVESKYKAQKASEMEYLRAKTTVSNAIPNLFNAESSIVLALWQLKAVMGIDLDTDIDTVGDIDDYAEHMFYDIHQNDSISLANNSTMRQLAIQAEELANTIKVQKYANIPTLSAVFNFSVNAMTNDFNFSQYKWTPYSYVGLSLSIPIFAGGKRANNIRQAKNQYEQLQLRTTDTERQLKIAIRQSLNTMETNMKSYYAAQDAVVSAQKAYDIAEKSYQVGRSTLIELNDAQLALTQARLAQSQAVYNFVVAKAQLEQTLGQDFTE